MGYQLRSYFKILYFFAFLWLLACPFANIVAQEVCPCENCPSPILDETVVHEFHTNIFNVRNNDLANPDQCVSKVNIKFRHNYLGDVEMFLISPAGQRIQLIGPVTFSLGVNGSTDNTSFEVGFVPSTEVAQPENGFSPTWDNEQVWLLIGRPRMGTYYPFKNKLEDLNTGKVNGTWTLQVIDSNPEKNDEGELLDFSIEFCDSEGLVCDPCLDPEDDPCVLMVDPSEAFVVPDENFCLPIYAKNVAFLKEFYFDLNWDASTLQFSHVDSFRIEFLDTNHFDLSATNEGRLGFNYTHDTDSLGLVVQDSTPIFQVCYQAIGQVGDSSIITLSNPPVGINVDNMAMESSAMEGGVNIAVDSTADCIRAIQLCDNSLISVDKSRGPGFNETEGGSCFPAQEEHQAKWYKFDILQTGNLEFAIHPKGSAGYGFTLYKGACPSDASAQQIYCVAGSSTPTTDAIGVAISPQNSFGVANGAGFRPTLAVVEGESYYLLIDNFAANSVGFDLEFSQNSIIGDQNLRASIIDPITLTCTDPSINLDATNSSQGNNYEITWRTDTGVINTTVGIYEPLIQKGGTFFLEVEDKLTGCKVIDSVLVETDQIYPIATAGTGGMLDCNRPTLELSAAGSSIGNPFELNWNTANGHIRTDSSLQNIMIDSGGTYQVVISNTDNGCISMDEVIVTADFAQPQLTAEGSFISCRSSIANLAASSSTRNTMFEWSGGNLITPIVSPTVSVTDTGFFMITAIALNGCMTIDSVMVRDDRVFPIVEAGDSLVLNCENPILNLDGTGSDMGEEFSYLWTSQNGHFTPDSDLSTLNPRIDSTGVYYLKVSNEINGCARTDSVFVDTNFLLPIVQIQADSVLNCYQPTITIDASATDSGAIYDFDWFISEGNIITGANSYHPTVDKAGSYILNIHNTENGCRASALLSITEDKVPPTANAGIDQTLNCSNRVLILEGNDGLVNTDYIYNWRSETGHFIGESNMLQVNVDSGGVYTLNVSNTINGCIAADSLVISEDFVKPNLLIPNDSTLTCRNPIISLIATSAAPNTNFSWLFPNGNTSETAIIESSQIGKHIAQATAANGCVQTDSLILDVDQDFPNIIIDLPDSITCSAPIVMINADKSDQGSHIQSVWATRDGHFIDDAQQNTLTPLVDSAGVYVLEISNSQTGCTIRDSISVIDDTDPPMIEITKIPDTLTCTNTTTSISIATNVSNPDLQWKLGEVDLSKEATLEVDNPGAYNILIINPQNNCASRFTVEVFNDTIAPIAEAGNTQELNCAIGSVQLDGSASSQGNNFVYLWTNQASSNISDTITALVEKPDLYTLTVVDQHNGCRSIDTARVTESLQNPIADAGEDVNFCIGEEDVELIIGGDKTSKGAIFSYKWLNLNNTPLGTDTFLAVNQAGIYILEVLNTENSCISTDTVSVFEKMRPVITVSQSGGINCKENEVIYLAESDIASAKVQWQGPDNLIINEAALRLTDTLLGVEYIAFAEDSLTGCRATSNIIKATEDRLAPLIDAGKNTKINCTDTLRLDGQLLSQLTDVNIQWATENGNINGNTDTLNPIVDAAGSYILTIENTKNFCSASDTVLVDSDQVLPEVTLGADTLLTCFEPNITLIPLNVSEGNGIFYEWRNADNQLIGDAQTLNVSLEGSYQLKVIDSTNLCSNFDIIEVVDTLTPPTVEILRPDTIHCNNNQIDLSAVVNIENGQYQWTAERGRITAGVNTLQPTVDTGGIYQIEVTNNFSGCTSFKSIQVMDLRAPIEIEAGEDKSLTCYNDTSILISGAIFEPSENLVFNWTSTVDGFNSIDSSLIFQTDQVGIYILTVQDSISFCKAIDSLEVKNDVQSIEFRIGEDLFIDCQKNVVAIGDTSSGPVEGYIYEWSSEEGNILSGINSPTALVDQAGSYTLNILDTQNGCTFQDSQRVFDNKIFPTADVGMPQALTCVDDQLTIGGVNTSKGLAYIYQWSTEDGQFLEGENMPFASIDKAGTYHFLVQDTINKCADTSTITILDNKDFPAINLIDSLPFICTDDVITIEPTTSEVMGTLDFEWFTMNGEIASPETQFILDIAAPGTYFIRVGDTLNSCVTIDSVVVVDNRVLPKIADIVDRMLSCNNESILLDATGSATGTNIQYEWLNEMGSPLSNNDQLTINEAGTYILKVLNTQNSCANQDTFLIQNNINPPQNALFEIADPSCSDSENGFIEIASVTGGTAPYRYQINNSAPQTESLFMDLAANTYQVKIIDDLACEWDTTLALNQPAPIELAIMLNNENLITGDEAMLALSSNIPDTEIAQITWTPANISNCQDCIAINPILIRSTTISATLTDINGCMQTDSIYVEVGLAPVPNAITPNGDGSNDYFIIPTLEAEPDAFPNNELIIFNRWGDIVYKRAKYQNDWDGRNLNGNALPEGTYYYILRLDVREGEVIEGDITILR